MKEPLGIYTDVLNPKELQCFFKKQNTFYTLKAGGVKNNHNYIEVMFKLYWDTYTFHIYMYT